MLKKQTIAVHTPYVRPDAYGALAVPVYNNVAFEFGDAQEMADAFCNRINAPDYARMENPTVTNFEQRVKALTGAAHVTAFNSGMAAISNALLAVSAQGRTIVSSRHLFGNTLALISNTLLRFGVKPRLRDLTDLEAVEAAIDEKTCCVFLEIVTNPQQEVADLKAIAEIAHRKGVPVIADSTVIPFTETSLKELDIDIEVVSSTKYISGGGTSLGGLITDYGTFPVFRPEQGHGGMDIQRAGRELEKGPDRADDLLRARRGGHVEDPFFPGYPAFDRRAERNGDALRRSVPGQPGRDAGRQGQDDRGVRIRVRYERVPARGDRDGLRL